jgi:hypothetical protein
VLVTRAVGEHTSADELLTRAALESVVSIGLEPRPEDLSDVQLRLLAVQPTFDPRLVADRCEREGEHERAGLTDERLVRAESLPKGEVGGLLSEGPPSRALLSQPGQDERVGDRHGASRDALEDDTVFSDARRLGDGLHLDHRELAAVAHVAV